MSSESNEEAALLPGSSVRRNHTYKSQVRAPGPVDIRGDDRKINWELHKQMWENFCILSEIENAPTRVQKAEFFNSLGMEAVKICNGLDIGDEDTVSDIMGKIDGYCIGQTNDAMEQFKFNNRDQRPGESFSALVTDLRSMLKNCNFDNMTMYVEEMMLRNRIIQGINDKATQAKMLDKKNPDIDTIVNIARTCEATQLHLKTMAAGSSDVHKVTGQKHKFRRKKPHGGYKPTNILKCRFCSGKHPMKKELCPAWGKTCLVCKQKNHFKGSEKCPKVKGVHAVDVSSDDSDSSSIEDIYVVEAICGIDTPSDDSAVYCEMIVNESPVKFQIDCGASVNVIPLEFLSEIDRQNLEQRNAVKLKMWNGVSHPSAQP